MAKNKAPNIVAELGRPETASETAARKAENSRLYRSRKTVNNLVFSLLVTVGLVAIIYLMVPRAAGDFEDRSVDVAAAAEQAGADRPLAVPVVPDTWKAKQATLTSDEDVNVWQIHYTTENNRYASVVQAYMRDGSPVSSEWISARLEDQQANGSDSLGGVNWTVYDYPERKADQVLMRFGLAGMISGDTVLVYGTDDASVIRVLATEVADSLHARANTETTETKEA